MRVLKFILVSLIVFFVCGILTKKSVYAAGTTVCSAAVWPESREAVQYEIQFHFNVTNQSSSEDDPTAPIVEVRVDSPILVRGAGCDVCGGNFTLYEDSVRFHISEGAFPTGNTESMWVLVDVVSGTTYGTDFTVTALSAPDESEEFVGCSLSVVPTATPVPDPDATATPTSVPGATSTPTSAPGATSTPTPTPTPVPDTTPPTVTITTEFSETYVEAPQISGEATDARSTIAQVDYSTDGGNNWLPVDEIFDPNTTSTTFDFIPYIFDDGNYEIQARATDSEGNTGTSKIYTLVIDRLPPRIGGNLLSIGPQPLVPNEEGVIISMAGVEQKITLSAVGGPTSVDLLVGDETFSLDYSSETGLWSGIIDISETGLYELKTKSIDGASNEEERNLNPILVVDAGKVTDKETGDPVGKGEVSLFVQDPQTLIWALWDGKPFGQDNPYELKDGGIYQYFLPPGTYYLQIESPGYSTLTSQIFKLDSSTAFNADFELGRGKYFQIGPIKIRLPELFADKAEVELSKPQISVKKDGSLLIGKPATDFSLDTVMGDVLDLSKLKGHSSVVSFVNTWSPPAVEQYSVVSDMGSGVLRAGVIVSQETNSKVKIFKERGNYKTDIAVDPDGDLIEDFNISSLPTHFFLDRKGVIQKIVTGVLNKEELESIISSI